MKILNRPMFRYGGPIKEGIMDGIKEPRQGYKVPGMVFPGDVDRMMPNASKVFSEFSEKYMPPENINQGSKINEGMNTADVISNFSPNISQVPKSAYTEDEYRFKKEMDRVETDQRKRDYLKNMNVTDKYIDGYNEQSGKKEKVINVNYGKDNFADIPNVNTKSGENPFGYRDDGDPKQVGAINENPSGLEVENPEEKRGKSVNNILEKLGYARSQKNALYDALIKGGQRISKEGLGRDGLITDLIQDTSTSYDKPEKIREAAELMQIQQDLKLDQIKASKTNKMEEDFNFLSSKVGKAKATAILTKDDASSDDAYLRLKGLSNVTPNEAVLGAVRAMVNLGESDIAQEDIKGEISKKEYKEGIGQFKNSTEFKEKGAGVYVYEGIVVQIENDGTHEIIKTFGSVNDKAKKWFGLIDK